MILRCCNSANDLTSSPITLFIQGRDGKTFRMLCQGIAWIDKASFHLLQLRTDLLAPRPEVGLDQQTTKITYSEVRFADLATPLWFPRDVNVYIRFTHLSEALQYGKSGGCSGSRLARRESDLPQHAPLLELSALSRFHKNPAIPLSQSFFEGCGLRCQCLTCRRCSSQYLTSRVSRFIWS